MCVDMEEHEEMEEESSSTVSMVSGQGTFITDPGEGTVREDKGFRETSTSCCDGVSVLIESSHSGLWVGLSQTVQNVVWFSRGSSSRNRFQEG